MCHVSPLFHLSLPLWLRGDSPGPVQKNLHNPIVQSLEDLEDQKRKKKKEKMGEVEPASGEADCFSRCLSKSQPGCLATDDYVKLGHN